MNGQPQAPVPLFPEKGTEVIIGQKAGWALARSACYQEHKDLDRPSIVLLSIVQHSLLGQGKLILCGPVGFICSQFQYNEILLKQNQACEIHRNVDQDSSVLGRCVMAICKELADVSAESSCIFKNVLHSSETSVTVYQSIRRSCLEDLDLHELSILAITMASTGGRNKIPSYSCLEPSIATNSLIQSHGSLIT